MSYPESFRCVVAIPTRELFSGDVYYAEVPGFEGYYGVIRNHESLVAVNHAGGKLVLWLDPDGKEKVEILIHRGCTQMLHNHLAVLGRFGIRIEDIDVEIVKEKAEATRAKIEEMQTRLSEVEEDNVLESHIENEQVRLSWYDAQIDYMSKGASVAH